MDKQDTKSHDDTPRATRSAKSVFSDGARLRALRDERKLSNDRLAKEAAVSLAILERALAGKRPVGIQSLELIAKVFGKSVIEITAEVDKGQVDPSGVETPLSLQRIRNGAQFIKLVRRSAGNPWGRVRVDIGDLAESLDLAAAMLITKLTEYVESFGPPHNRPLGWESAWSDTQSELIRRTADYNSVIAGFNNQKIGLFAARYIYRIVDMEVVDEHWIEAGLAHPVDIDEVAWIELDHEHIALKFSQLDDDPDEDSISINRGLSNEDLKLIKEFCPHEEEVEYAPLAWLEAEKAKEKPVWTLPKVRLLNLTVHPDDDPVGGYLRRSPRPNSKRLSKVIKTRKKEAPE